MLPFAITLRPGEPIHDQVVYGVTRAVVTGQLRPGDPFPSVRSLSQDLRINPNTAHRIVATLVHEGVLTVRPGIGTIVGSASERAVAADRDGLDNDLERIVIEAKRAGMALQEVLAMVRKHWAMTVRRTG
jgi:GntR family transcriptional regulator